MKDKIFPLSVSELKLLENKSSETIPSSNCEELQEIIKNTRCIINSLEQGIIIYSPDLRYQMLSQNIEKIFWLKEENVIGKTLSEIFYSSEKEPIIKQLEDVLKWEAPYNLEYHLKINETGENLFVTKIAKAILNSKGKIIWILWIVTDITEKKLLFDAFQNTNEILTLFLKNSPIFAYIKEVNPTESRAIMLSDNFEKMLGVKPNNIIGKTMQEIFPPELAKKMTDIDYWVVLGDKVVTLEEEFNDCKYLSIKFPIKQSDKTLLAWYTIDITERKQTEENLRATKDLLLSITNSTLDLIFAKDKDWKYTFANKAFEKFLWKTNAEILGKDLTEILPETVGSTLLEREKEILQTWKYLTYEEILNNGEGIDRKLSIMKWPLYDSKWNLSWLFGISRDVTENRSIEEQLQIRQRMDSLWTLVWGICHDFNNLLAWILGNLELLQISWSFSDNQTKYIDNSILSTNRAAELIKQLQNLSRNSVSEKKVFDIYSVTSEVFDLLEKTTDKIVKKVIDFNPWDFYINWSDSEIHQVLLNLWTNAFKAIEEKVFKDWGLIKIRVENYRSRFTNEKTNLPEWYYVHILFEDNWVGMSEEVRKKAFDPLFTTRKKSWQRWQGLWLAMVYNIVTVKHDGHIYLESKQWKGTTVHIYLPKVLPQEKTTLNKRLELNWGIETILVVEDEKMLQEFVKSALEWYGYKVLVANDGKEWLDMYIENMSNIDLVILDLTMPKMSGQTVLSALLEIKENIKVIISSWQSDGEITEWILSKAKWFVHKPYPLQKLIKTVKDVLDEK